MLVRLLPVVDMGLLVVSFGSSGSVGFGSLLAPDDLALLEFSGTWSVPKVGVGSWGRGDWVENPPEG